MSAATLSELQFDNRFVRELPGDSSTSPRPRQVLGACYSRVTPTAVGKPRVLAVSREVAALLGLSEAACASEEFLQVFAGNRVLPGMEPYAACYGGHQFGNWAGQLGDGRAITLCETFGAQGQRLELQLKGAGLTPYSRTADGRAVLRSSLREFVCSEAMHHLGVPTTRALSLLATGEPVVRDMFYDGRAAAEPGAVVCRVAPTFLRFGNFELLAARKDYALLKTLVDATIASHFPELGAPSAETYARWFQAVCQRTVTMVVHWMRVGFVHGVMNTDNMSVLGLTIDYGPYGWLEGYDPDWTPNTTDAGGRRYRYGYQPRIAMWNLSCLASALVPLVGAVEPLEAALEAGLQSLDDQQSAMLNAKLGLRSDALDEDGLVASLPDVLKRCETDMTIFFRQLAQVPTIGANGGPPTDAELVAPLHAAYYAPDDVAVYTPTIAAWLRRYLERLQREGAPVEERRARMNAVNPKYVFRNYLAQLAIDQAEHGDVTELNSLLEVLRHPYDEQPGQERFAEKRPEWARHRAGCSMLSCSS